MRGVASAERWWKTDGVKLTIWFASDDLQRLDERGCDRVTGRLGSRSTMVCQKGGLDDLVSRQ